MPSETVDTPGGWGRNIAARRTQLGLTQQQLSERVGGIAPNTVARWEQGARLPGIPDQRRIAAALETTITELFPRDDNEAELVAIAATGGGCS